MSKIICDVCGTTYPETAAQCPICGCAKSADTRTVTGDKVNPDGAAASSYQYVKGGRFSKKNVVKRNRDSLPRQEKKTAVSKADGKKEDTGANKGLTALMLVLIVAIVIVAIYIALRFFVPGVNGPTPTTDPTNTPSTSDPDHSTTEPTEAPTTEPTVPCTGLSVRESDILLDTPGSTAKIQVTVDPADTTDDVVFASDNETVATVSEDGTVTAVGEGTARITVTCGSFQVYCDVDVVYATSEPTTEPTTEPTAPPTEKVEYKLYINGAPPGYFGADVTVSVGEKITLTVVDPDGNAMPVTWTANKSGRVTINGNVITAASAGSAVEVSAEYEGETFTCIVRIG